MGLVGIKDDFLHGEDAKTLSFLRTLVLLWFWWIGFELNAEARRSRRFFFLKSGGLSLRGLRLRIFHREDAKVGELLGPRS